jgi:bla regulator protein BlaR1
MIPKFLTEIWTSVAPWLGNHLWQSTLFACAAALLTLAFRNNHARTRHALWLAASLKFLVPFSFLSNLGSYLVSSHAPVGTRTVLYSALEQFGQPFAAQVIPGVSQTASATVTPSPIHLLPALLIVWLCGFLVVAFFWLMRWLHVRHSIRGTVPLSEGREVEALRRLLREHGMPGAIKILLSRTSLEPGIFGIARPVLVWPQGISDRLDDAHLEAVLAHEMRHVRRRDNLAAALHMLVEAVFWFHPLVWWLGTRLIAERERACDEEVLESGSDRQVYAESILKICEFCVGSPLTCVSGVTGADLKKRIHRIMSQQVARKLDVRRKLLLGAAVVLAVAAPIVAGAFRVTPRLAASLAQNATTAMRAYTSVSIKPSKTPSFGFILGFGPNGFRSSAPLQQVIRTAYGVQDDRIIGAPDWLNSEKYDFEANEDNAGDSDPRKLSFDQNASEQARMLQQVLADRLKLALHRETRGLSVYALVLAKGGSKLQESKPGDTYPTGFKSRDGIARPGGIHFESYLEDGAHVEHGNKLIAQGVPVGALLWHLQAFLDRTIVDETGLSGTYDFTFQVPSLPPIEASGRILSAALEQELGLKLEPRTVPMEVLVIDHVERPVASATQNVASTVPAFHVVSIKANGSGDQFSHTNFSTNPGDTSAFTDGRLSGTNVPLISYIYFAYKLTGSQFQLLLPTVPSWLISDRFDIQAQAEGNPSNDQMRLMTQAVLADRFHLAAHYESRQVPVYGLLLAKPGETGPQLQPHSDDPPCSTPPPPASEGRWNFPPTVAGGFPVDCGHIEALPSSRIRVGARKIPIGLLAATLPQMHNLNRPVVDQTGLAGNYDFTFEWTARRVDRANPRGEKPAPGFVRDLHDQLGLRLEPQTGPADVFVIDHVERPAEP